MRARPYSYAHICIFGYENIRIFGYWAQKNIRHPGGGAAHTGQGRGASDLAVLFEQQFDGLVDEIVVGHIVFVPHLL